MTLETEVAKLFSREYRAGINPRETAKKVVELVRASGNRTEAFRHCQ